MILSQQDTRWANVKIGYSNYTIKYYGCLITNLAMIEGTTPDVVNMKLKKAGGFDGAMVIWSKINAAFPDLHFEKRVHFYNQTLVDNAVHRNGFCLVEVDFDNNPNTLGNHWILKTPEGYADPWTGKFKDYRIKKGFAILNKDKEIIGDITMNEAQAEKLIGAIRASNLLKRAELASQLVTPDEKTYYLRINGKDYWIADVNVFDGLGYGGKFGKATKTKVNPIY